MQWNPRPCGRPKLPDDLRQLILRMAAENPIWGEARIADELQLKLGIRVSPRTVGKYLSGRGSRCTPDLTHSWMTFVRNQAMRIVFVIMAGEIGGIGVRSVERAQLPPRPRLG